MNVAWLGVVVLFSFGLQAHAQSTASEPALRVNVEPGPHYQDVAARLQIVLDGFEAEPPPQVDIGTPDGAEVEFVGTSPSVSSRIEIINGQMRQWKTVRHIFEYRVLPKRVGQIRLGPFRATQDATEAMSPLISMRIGGLAASQEQQIKLELPDGPHWVGRPIIATVTWSISAALAERMGSRNINVPAFGANDHFRYEDVPAVNPRLNLSITSGVTVREYPAEMQRENRSDGPYLVFTVKRKLIPLRAGEFSIEPSTVVAEEVVRWRRNLFGDRIPGTTRRVKATDTPLTLNVREAPPENRPDNWSGIVGSGVSLTTTINRSVVQAGDPVELTISVTGDALLENLSLPSLESMGLSTQNFRILEEPTSGVVDNGTKVFKATIRPLHDGIKEIPPLSLSWFEPDSGQYTASASAPIAVSIRNANVVSANDVIRSPSGATNREDATPEASTRPTERKTPSSSSVRSALNSTELAGADLAIEKRLTELAVGREVWLARTPVVFGIHIFAAVILLFGIWLGRRRRRDPALVKAAGDLIRLRSALLEATTYGELATALRQLARSNLSFRRDLHDGLLAECDAIAYAPKAATGMSLTEKVSADTRQLADSVVAAPA